MNHIDSTRAITREIWQTWKYSRYPKPLERCIKSFKIMNPSWSTNLCSDLDIVSLIETEFPELRDILARFPSGIYIADIWRCLILYRFGGIYADIDVECIQPLDDLLDAIKSNGLDSDETEVFLCRDHPLHEEWHYGGREMYMNFFMIARPKAEFFKMYINRLIRLASETEGPISGGVINLTGPGAFTELVEEAGSPEALGVSVLPWQWLSPLPNMSVAWDFENRPYYDQLIRRGDWAWELNPFVAHYWWHNYSSPRSMITVYDSLLFQSHGRIVNRWLEKTIPQNDPKKEFQACALAEFAELEEGVFVESGSSNEASSLSKLASGVLERLGRIRLTELPEDDARIGLLEIGDDGGKSLHRFASALERELFVPNGLVCIPEEEMSVNHSGEEALQLALSSGFRLLEDMGGILLQAPDPNDRVLIPKIIHQTWKDHTIPDSFRKDWIDSWMEKNGPNGWQYRFWTDEDLLALVEEDFPDFIDCYLNYDHPIKRVDAARYLILKRHGGLYVDLDFVCLKPFEQLLSRRTLMFGSEYDSPETHKDSICNALMASVPEHPFWTGIEADLRACAKAKVLEATGPHFLGNRLRNSLHFLDRKDYPTVVNREVLYPFRWNAEERDDARGATLDELAERYPNSHAVTLWAGTWLVENGDNISSISNESSRNSGRLSSAFHGGWKAPRNARLKYFQEAGGGHYDARYFRGTLLPLKIREVLFQLSREFLRICEVFEVQAVLMHGGLLGWFWSGKPFPWDNDLDFCIPYDDLLRLESLLPSDLKYDELNFLLDINPNHRKRKSLNEHWKENREQNKIDARFIHRETGLFIDITALTADSEFLVTKCPHRYKKEDLMPFSKADFCGNEVNVPANPEAVLEQEYGKRALTEPSFKNWVFDWFLRDWTTKEPQTKPPAPKPWDEVETGPLLHIRKDAKVFRRERRRMGPMQSIYNEKIDKEIVDLMDYFGELRPWLAMCCKSVKENWWIDLSSSLRLGDNGSDLFVDRCYLNADVVVCGSFFIRLTEEIIIWSRGQGLNHWAAEMLVSVPKLEGPATLWQKEFGRKFLVDWDRAPSEIRPELLLKVMMELGKARVLETTASRMGWRVR